ncbi:MAG: hypothetical protein ACRBFS_10415 [Aureispira sp.]
MKKEDIPQDKSDLASYTREVCYGQKEDGTYETALSTGWSVKTEALDQAWEEAHRRTEAALIAIEQGEASPILYFMERNLMDLPTLTAYVGLWSFRVKRHLKMRPFSRLKDPLLTRYAKAFRITTNELKNFDVNDYKGI